MSSRRFVRFGLRKRYPVIAGVDSFVRNNGRFDIIAGMTAIENSGTTAAILSQLYHVPFVIRENRTYYTRGLMTGDYKKRTADVIDLAHAVLPVSHTLGDNIVYTLDVEPRLLMTLPNPVADELFCQPAGHNQFSQFRGDNFCFVGWTNWRDIKRIDIAIGAFATVHQQMQRTRMILAGPVPRWARVRVNEMGLGDAVWLTGPIDRTGIHQLAHACDCCIVPSDHDPGNNSVLEAMAAGKPVIVTRCGGSESRITDERLGRIVDKGDPSAFAAAMAEVAGGSFVHDPQVIMSECRRMYSVEALSARLSEIYRRVASLSA